MSQVLKPLKFQTLLKFVFKGEYKRKVRKMGHILSLKGIKSHLSIAYKFLDTEDKVTIFTWRVSSRTILNNILFPSTELGSAVTRHWLVNKNKICLITEPNVKESSILFKVNLLKKKKIESMIPASPFPLRQNNNNYIFLQPHWLSQKCS